MRDSKIYSYMKIPGLDLDKTPTIVNWNNIEGRPRKEDYSRALRAEIRDPLWMLTKQWQMGEFEGDDAGSPVQARVLLHKERLTKYKSAHDDPQFFNNNIPLEALVEQLPLPFNQSDKQALLDIRIMMGRYWLKMVGADLTRSREYASAYPIITPQSPNNVNEELILAHPETWQKFAAASGRIMDGYEFYLQLKAGRTKSDDFDDEQVITDFGSKYIECVEGFFLQPTETQKGAYLPSRLEYQFKCSAPDANGDKIFEAEEYYTGRLDWFNLTINDNAAPMHVSGSPPANVEGAIRNEDIFIKEQYTFIPANIDYEGMPDTRWWKFEDRNTYLGDIKPDTTDLSKLLFLEFSLLYANDWFLLPQQLPAGSITDIKGLVVTNCFGERTWIGPTGTGPDKDWNSWTMFTINRKDKDLKEADHSLIILPTVSRIQESEPLEQVILIRDEVANMVWAIETDISLLSGDRTKGAEAVRELIAFYERLHKEDKNLEPSDQATIRYRIMNSVPENWIPFIPVHMKEDNREIQLQRASMPRVVPGQEDYKPVKPRTSLIRHGLDKNPAEAYYIFEEEVPRAGVCIKKTFQRTRWYGGLVYNWLGIHKTTGRGEGSSGLKFDQIVSK